MFESADSGAETEQGETTMKYMLMMHAPRGNGDWQIAGWTPEEIQAHIAFMLRLNQELAESGELVGAEGLAVPGEARIVRAGKNGAPLVTDGPYPEAKEFLAGFWIVEVDRTERAHEIAARASSAPGPGGTPMAIPIEVRQVMQGPPPQDA
jgi:hypothetical protein